MNSKKWAATFCLLSGILVAVTAARGEDSLPIAMLNMDRVVKSHQPLLDRLKPLQDEAKQVQEKLQVRQAEIETVAAQLQKTQPGSPEFQRLQVQAVKLQGELQKFVQAEQQALQKKELAIHVAFHREVEEEVAKYAKAKGLKLVLRQQDISLDDNQPLQEIVKSLNRSIIYQDGLDITDDILKALDARAASKP